MRVLIDYRPALRDRSGVGEYTHQLVRTARLAYAVYLQAVEARQPAARIH